MVFRRWMIVIVACALLVLALAGYKFVQIRQLIAFAESFPEPSETVEVHRAGPVRWQESTTTVGEVLAPQTIALRNEVEGRVVAVGFAAGDNVHKDQMLVQLDASEEIAQLRAAQADAELARLALARYDKLVTQKLSSREQYDQARAQHAMAEARAQALQAVIDKKTLTAPFDGRAGLHTLQPGQYLAANTEITQLVGNQQALWVDFTLPQQLAGISTGSAVTVKLRDVLAEPLAGQVIAVDPQVSSRSRNLGLRATISNTGLLLKPGMLVDVQVTTAAPRDVIAVPATAVLHDKAGSYVFVLADDGKGQLRAARRDIVTGAEKDGLVMVASGLAGGEQIAANGAYKLQDGMVANPANRAGQQP